MCERRDSDGHQHRTCEIAENSRQHFNSVHHNTVCGGLYPYSIAGGQGSDFNSVITTRQWITFYGDGNIVHNTLQKSSTSGGRSANVTFTNTVAAFVSSE